MPDVADIYSTLSVEDVFEKLKTSRHGITNEEAAKRLAEFGPNVISEKVELSVVIEFFSHFTNPLVLILIFATAISAYFGEITNSIIISMMILASVTLDFFEEHSANRAAKKLREKVGHIATVIRSGIEIDVKASDICVGDVVFLNSGDLIPADARVIEADDFFVNQSSLTGESFPLEKAPNAPHDRGIDDNTTVIFLGSNVISGTAKAVVFKTGAETEFGKIATSLDEKDKSEFEEGIKSFGYLIMKVILSLVVFIFFCNSIVNHNVLESFMFAIAIAVGITPELLPIIMSITMARGSLKMARNGVIVKRLSAIPNFGSMDILCTDKTGTLTEDNIHLVTYTDIYGVNDEKVFLSAYLNSFYQTGVQNPLDQAVMEYRKTDVAVYKKVEEIPFDFFRKMMSIAVEGPDGRVLITKGAPEEVIARSTHFNAKGNKEPFTEEARRAAFAYYEATSAEGYRVLAVASRGDLPVKEQYAATDEGGLELLGFVAFLDPAKKGVEQVLREIGEQGVEIKVITGDNELVAKRICSDVGLPIKDVLLGRDSAALSDEDLRRVAEKTTIFARFSPDEKRRVITALRSGGHIVGYLGDGINDAPSLKAADVGISVENAVDVAKESADIILTKKSLRSIIDGVLEGRRSFGNTMKYIMMGLSSNFGNMFSVAGAIFYIPFLPMLPIQILLNNFIYDSSQVSIPSDKVDADWVRKPRKWDLKLIKKFMYVFGPISSLFDFLTFFILFSVFKANEATFQTGWFIESLATQTLVIHVIRTRKIPFIQSRASNMLLFTTFLAVAVGWTLPFTPVGKFFSFTPLPLNILFAIGGLVLVYLFVVEIVKRVFYKNFDPERA